MPIERQVKLLAVAAEVFGQLASGSSGKLLANPVIVLVRRGVPYRTCATPSGLQPTETCPSGVLSHAQESSVIPAFSLIW
jgi:hypothetical protein